MCLTTPTIILLFISLWVSCFSQPYESLPFEKVSTRYGKSGFGPCPKVTPMDNFDVTKIYGEKWYLIAHYSFEFLLDRHCMEIRYRNHASSEPENPCRLAGFYNTTGLTDGAIKTEQYYRMLPNVSEPGLWINTVRNSAVKSIVLDTDYYTYLLWHECMEFPRDNPIFYEQQNYIHSRVAVWEEDMHKAYEHIYEDLGIENEPFVWHDQKNCER